MKKVQLIISLIVLYVTSGHAQLNTVSSQITKQNYLQFTPKIGYDILPMYDNNTPYIKYKGGIYAGLSADYFFSNFGIGVDVDYIQNKPQSNYPTSGLINAALVTLTSFSLVEKPITRLFYGIGPSYKYQSPSGNWTTALTARVGLGSVKGGRVEHRETTTLPKELLNFHAGYNAKNLLSTKLQLNTTYFFKPSIGLSFGAYYIYHFKATELKDPVLGFSAKYAQLVNSPSNINSLTGIQNTRTESCNCSVSSVGVFAGLTLKLGKTKKIRPEDCKPEYSLVVTAKDKLSGELLPYTEVVIKSKDGINSKRGVTNAFGVVVFENIKPFEYDIDGTLAKAALEGNKASTNEFFKKKVVQKTIYYTKSGFIIQGKIFECNSNKPLKGINVIIGKTDLSFVDMTLSQEDGSFMLQIPEQDIYSLYGKKEKYYSQIEEVNPANYNRSKNLFVKVEICMEPVECGKAIQLKNILFDLDKYAIKDAAKKELNKLIRFMKDNPSLKVELGSHTDCRNTNVYNQTLSQNRANASVDYLVSQGINRDRLIGVGYGETKLLNGCADGVNCTEAEHTINRRTEMKVICPNNK